MVGRHASSFSWEHNGGPVVEEATLVLDARVIQSPKHGYEDGKSAKRRYILQHPMGRKVLIAQALRHLAETPGGHVAFGCRLGQDRSVVLAEEVNRIMTKQKEGI